MHHLKSCICQTGVYFVVVLVQQRYATVEHNYNELSARYQEVVAVKQHLESEVLMLQSALDAERNARKHEAQISAELNGKS